MTIARPVATAVAALLMIAPAFAKNFAVPTKNPAVTITVPNDWKTQAIGYGYSARPQDESVFFSVEFADARNIDKMMATNDAWMKENKIKKVEPIKADAPLNGIPATVFQYRTTDENGPTKVDFILLPAGENRVIMLTVWGSDEEREAHGNELDAIFGSIKSIN
ncbi:hypothetical protein [Bosea sp. PAMC 26642]|uniref:hypothetical protein n=1 Tax=Bosea sp. (strain PAMC 26642) TaxID=1792307 RepID=UPI00076FE415|nr:hypothetical protein [Bosea sp. PAMC 26642]AMJ61186.1 hypothetical protein AXW83_13555 [Bosea sp. PAMC 26642]